MNLVPAFGKINDHYEYENSEGINERCPLAGIGCCTAGAGVCGGLGGAGIRVGAGGAAGFGEAGDARGDCRCAGRGVYGEF